MKAKMNAGLCLAVVVAIMAAAASADMIFPLSATQANYTQLGTPDEVKDGSASLTLYKKEDNTNRADPYIDFDLSSLAGLTSGDIISATLKLRGWEGLNSGSTTYLYYCTEAWDETTITWNNAPASTDSGISFIPTASGEGYNNNIDITSLVKNWVDGTWPEYGVHLFYGSDSSYRRTKFRGIESTEGYAPMIEVVATPEPATLTLIGMGGLTLLRRRSR